MRTFGGIALGFLIGFLAQDWGKLDRDARDREIREAVESEIRHQFLKRDAKEQEA